MRKVILCLIAVVVYTMAFSQEFKASIDLNVKAPGGSYGDGCANHIIVYLRFSDGSQIEVLPEVDLNNASTSVYSNYTNSVTFSASKIPVQVITSTSRNWHRTIGGCGGNGSFDDAKGANAISYCNNSFDELSDGQNNNSVAEWWTTNFTLTIFPQISLTQPIDNAFGTDDRLNVKCNESGFPPFVYNWEYYTDGDVSTQQVWIPPGLFRPGRWETRTTVNWHSFPAQYHGLDALNLTATELFAGSGLDVDTLISKNVYVRINACSGSAPSNIIVLNIRKSPPHITSIATTPSTCFDSDNGTIKLSFDRALLTQEKIQFNLVNANDPSLFYDPSTDTLGDNNNYVIPQDLPPGQYILKYSARTFTQTGDESWSNLITTDPITITAPTAVAFTTSKTDVWCYDGSDGVITLNATGGVGAYQYMIKRQGEPDSTWYDFSATSTNNIAGIIKGNYEIQVQDGNQCVAKTAAYGSVISLPVTINQPNAPLQINEVKKVNPTAFGYANGYFVADVVGGTPNADGSYNFLFKKLNDVAINSGITTSVTGSGYRIRVDGLADGTYVLTTNDKNRSSATTAQGCEATDTIVITEPQPIIVKFEIIDSVLCKDDANGTLAVHATGGITFGLPALPYQYAWKKKDASGTYQVMTNFTDSIAANLTTGWYAVNVTDGNGISLVADSTFFLPEPAELLVNLSKVDVTCSGLPNGQVFATVIGGTQPFSYYWNTSDETTSIANVPAGTYMVWIEDYHHCETQKNIVVNQPNDIQLQVIKKDPTCNNGADGSINVAVNGGSAPFTYNWTGTTSSTGNATSLKSGTYTVRITDAKGCNLLETDTLINPEPILVHLGPDRYICSAQQIDYDVTVKGSGYYTYDWTSNIGFASSSPTVTLIQAGTYYATVKDANNCTGSDMLVLTAIDTQVSNDFALPTQGYAGEKIVIANLTSPKADSVKWSLPANANIISQSDQMVEMILKDTGSYYASLRTYKGLCYADQTKKIIINNQANLPDPGSARNPFIVDFSAAPIPNNGSFTVYVTLQSASQIELKLINVLTSQITSLSKQAGSDKYTIPVKSSLSAGTYVLLLETPKGRETIKLLIL